ncbi:hypothetical protein CYMTET_10735 [Cymbomonas tetramitiformis]|uniref:Uncharacterized protein n=1 Tax=Cymbomonas tetramitiformis TaxID=36881 RepID=A0AAE0LDQ1_9CHLO|nr:hypothetical protein CYMTET_10735 [Cymbomonas tetramitiformis]
MSENSRGITVSGTCDGYCQFIIVEKTGDKRRCTRKVDGGDGLRFCGTHKKLKDKERKEKGKGKAIHVPSETSDVEESDEEVSHMTTSTLNNKMAACKLTTHERNVEACDDDELHLKYGLYDQPDENIGDE